MEKNLKMSDEFYMHQALAFAEKAEEEREVPIGAVVVSAVGEVIGFGYNQVEKRKTQIAHAELLALQVASNKYNDWRLENCLLYVTLEPCTMCMGAIRLSRIRRVIFGAYSNLFGCHLDRDSFTPLYNKDAPILEGGICRQACIDILKRFFQKRREQSERIKKNK